MSRDTHCKDRSEEVSSSNLVEGKVITEQTEGCGAE